MKLFAFLLVATMWLTAASSWAAPVSWTNPTQYTDGTQLPAADIVATNIYCTANSTAPGPAPVFTTAQTITGAGSTGDITLPGARYCALTTVALMPGPAPRESRESDYSVAVLLDPKRPGSGAGLKVQSVAPFSCPTGAVCPRP